MKIIYKSHDGFLFLSNPFDNANYYLENSDNKEHTLELLIIMRGLTTNKEEQ